MKTPETQEKLGVNTQKRVPENVDVKTKTFLFFSSYNRLSITRTLCYLEQKLISPGFP